MKTSLILWCLLATLSANASAAPDGPQDYAWRMAVTPAAGAGVVRLPVPREAYLHARRADLSDLRVFDANGKALAFAVGAPASQSATERREIPARLFPLKGAPASSEGLQNVEIRTSSDGRLLSVSALSGASTGAGPDARRTDALQALILDLGRQSEQSRIGALRFALPAGTGNYSAQVLLEVSDDLKQWDAIGTTTLNWLSNSDTQTLANDSMAFAPRHFRYARLSWQDGEPLAFGAITALALSQSAVPPARASITLQGKQGKQADQWLYATPPAIPADSIGLQLDQPNTVLPVTLGIVRQAEASAVRPHRLYRQHRQPRPAQGSYIEPLLNTTFYRISNGDKERVSGDLAMPVVQASQWVLQSNTTAPISQPPALRLGWTPDTLFFLANGKAPYQLVFGNRQASPAALPLSQVAPGFQPAELLALPAATTGALLAQAGALAEAQAGSPESITNKGNPSWRLAALWGALLLGVAVLGFFAWRLLTQMRHESEQTHTTGDGNDQA